MLYIMNAPVLTSFGYFSFVVLDWGVAEQMLKHIEWTSAVGHQGTAEILSEILKTEILMNRIEVEMEEGDKAIVFWLRKRLPEGTIATKEQLLKADYTIALMHRIH